MRAVIQRVDRARVAVDDEVVGEIGAGLAVLVGVTHTDADADADAVAAKVAGLRIFGDGERAMNRSVADVAGSILVVSQFTLYADARKGRRPSFSEAAPAEVAEPLVNRVVEKLRGAGIPVATGRFGAVMAVELVNAGPVTITLETEAGRLV